MVLAYIRAGFMPQTGCNKQAALEWVQWELENENVRYNEETSAIEVLVEVLPNTFQWLESGYWWECNHLLKRIK